MVKKRTTLLHTNRKTFLPFDYAWAYDAWLRSEQSHWLHSELSMNEDVKDWKLNLTEPERNFLTHILRFFVQGDLDVSEGYVDHYLPLFRQPEVRMMLTSFSARESIHVAAYSHLIETLGLPETTYNDFMKYDEMRKKHEYLFDFDFLKPENKDDLKSTALKIAVFSGFTEGLQLFSSFVMLLNFPRNSVMKSLGQIISWSQIDEQHHCDSMIKLFRTFLNEHREIWDDELKGQIYTICTKMVEMEDAFIDLAFSSCGGSMRDLTAEQVKSYIRYIADRRLITMGMKGIFKERKNPLPWVEEMVNAPTHSNFFEVKSSDYAKGALSGSWDQIFPMPTTTKLLETKKEENAENLKVDVV